MLRLSDAVYHSPLRPQLAQGTAERLAYIKACEFCSACRSALHFKMVFEKASSTNLQCHDDELRQPNELLCLLAESDSFHLKDLFVGGCCAGKHPAWL